MVPGRFSWFFMVPGWFFMFSHLGCGRIPQFIEKCLLLCCMTLREQTVLECSLLRSIQHKADISSVHHSAVFSTQLASALKGCSASGTPRGLRCPHSSPFPTSFHFVQVTPSRLCTQGFIIPFSVVIFSLVLFN